mgnify:CR=1 FL=1
MSYERDLLQRHFGKGTGWDEGDVCIGQTVNVQVNQCFFNVLLGCG